MSLTPGEPVNFGLALVDVHFWNHFIAYKIKSAKEMGGVLEERDAETLELLFDRFLVPAKEGEELKFADYISNSPILEPLQNAYQRIQQLLDLNERRINLEGIDKAVQILRDEVQPVLSEYLS